MNAARAFGSFSALSHRRDQRAQRCLAMGGKPLTSLALVCFPEKGDLEILERILAGGLSKMIEAGCTVVGGHSIRDEETKFGYSVTGVVDPHRVLANQGAQPGDRLAQAERARPAPVLFLRQIAPGRSFALDSR